MTKEIWKAIPGYVDYYEVSNTGKVRSLTREVFNPLCGTMTLKGRELKPSLSNRALRVWLSLDGETKRYFVRVLVAELFLPNPDELPTVYHIDGDYMNCDVNNLKWGTVSDAIVNAHTVKNTGFLVPVRDSLGREYRTMAEAERALGVYTNTIFRVLKGESRRQSTRGLRFTKI
jgi:hypothetical protein